MFSTSLADATSRAVSAKAKGKVVHVSLRLLSLESHLIHLHNFFHSWNFPSELVFDKDDLPSIDDSETEEDTRAFLSRSEHVCARQWERMWNWKRWWKYFFLFCRRDVLLYTAERLCRNKSHIYELFSFSGGDQAWYNALYDAHNSLQKCH